jgi:hypothetical protein
MTKMQDENKIAQLFFLNKTNFLSISKTLAFLFRQEKPDNQEKPAHAAAALPTTAVQDSI